MAFNLFRKKEVADSIYTNGTIYTMDPENPLVTSLACTNGIIIALGDESILSDYQGDATTIVDLQGKFVLPGFIETNGQTVNTVFEESYLQLDEEMSSEEILSKLAAFVQAHPQVDSYLAYGYNEALIDQDMHIKLRESMDCISKDKAILAIASDGYHLLVNSFAAEIVQARAEELQIPLITPTFVLNTLISIDYELLIKNAFIESRKAAQSGYTSVFNKKTFHYFDSTYRDLLIDMYQAGLIKQRFFSSFLLNRQLPDRQVFHIMDQGRTACTELEEKVHFNTLYIQYSSDEDKPHYMSAEYISGICSKAADKGYHIRIAAFDKSAALNALDILGNLQPSYKKSAFSVEHAEILTEEELSHIFTGNVHVFDKNCSLREQDAQGSIDELTIKAAEYLGISHRCGSLQQGKWADFSVYSQDPANLETGADVKKLKTDMVVLNGDIIYVDGRDHVNDWIKEMTEHVSSVSEDFCL